jgi:SAM-dependent methyltransferase
MKNKIIIRLKRIIFGKFKPQGIGTMDDFDWTTYSYLYRDELKNGSRQFTHRVNLDDFKQVNGELTKTNPNGLSLHPNHRLLYETILQLQPQSVVELGCGGGNHCRNLMVLAPEVDISGYDVSAEQLTLLREINPELPASAFQLLDLTLPAPDSYPKRDLAFTQAVIMHIHAGKGHLVALSNLFKLASKQVVLMENWGRHDFKADIKALHNAKIIAWKELYFYFRPSPEQLNRPHIMIISATKLSQYTQLDDQLSPTTKR